MFDLLYALAALLVANGYVFGLFLTSVVYGKVTHAFMAFSASLMFLFLFYRGTALQSSATAMATAVFTLGVSAGALWEIFEWSIDIIDGLADTITDLLADIVGSLIAAILAIAIRRCGSRRHSGPPSV
ncbi:MAG: hypothetical protein M3120_04395 [Pseudomonadota bacterium]|nr:hypothetical protein [Pseudomonadota bacterium]